MNKISSIYILKKQSIDNRYKSCYSNNVIDSLIETLQNKYFIQIDILSYIFV